MPIMSSQHAARSFWRLLAIAAVFTVGGATAIMNAQFGYRLGEDELARIVLMVFSVALDVFKWIAPIAATAAWARQAYLRAGAAVLLWLVAGSWSFAAAVGFSAMNRDIIVAGRASVIADRDRSTASWQAAQRTLATLQTSPRWSSTQACTNATAPASVAYCAEVAAAKAALNRADDELRNAGPVASADPQAELLSRTIGLSLPTAQLTLTVMVAVVAELMSMLGFFAVTDSYTARPRQQAVECVSTARPTKGPDAPAKPLAAPVDAAPVPVMKRPPVRLPPRQPNRTSSSLDTREITHTTHDN